MKATQTFSILIWANKAKMTDNEAPIFARVTVDGKRAEIFTERHKTGEKVRVPLLSVASNLAGQRTQQSEPVM